MVTRCVISVSGGLGDMISLLPIFVKFDGFLVLSDQYRELFSPYELDVLWWKERASLAENVLRLSFEIRRRKPGFVYGTYPNGRRTNILLALSPGTKLFYDDLNFSTRRLVDLAKLSRGSRAILAPFDRVRESYVSLNSKLIGVVPKYPFDMIEKEEFAIEAEKFSRERYALIHPTSKYITKRWPLERFIRIAGRFVGSGLRVVFVFARDETAELGKVRECFGNEIVKGRVLLLHGESILKVISYVKRAYLFLGNDSAIAHIAGISGVRTFVIYGYTRYYHTAPYGAHVIRLELPCSPCYNFAKGELAVARECNYDFVCLKGIDENMVWKTVSPFL